jgi:nucleoid DNA-binding protein
LHLIYERGHLKNDKGRFGRCYGKRSGYVGALTKELKKGGKIGLVGFGTFSVSKRKAREGRNPQTGATIKIPAKKVVKFKAGKELAEKVN